MIRPLAVCLLVLLVSGAEDGGHTTQALDANSEPLEKHTVDSIDNELLQLAEATELDGKSKERFHDFIELDADTRQQIVQELKAESTAESETQAKWGFLKNIVNLDRLLVGGVSADNFDSEETCDDDPEEDDMPKVLGSTKSDAVQAAQPKLIGDSESGEVEIPASGEACEEDTEQRRDAESRLKNARENEYRKRMDARLARDEHDREAKELERMENEATEQEHLDRQRIKVKATQAARKKAEQERKKAERHQAMERAKEDARRAKAAKQAKLRQMGLQDKLDNEKLETAQAKAKASAETEARKAAERTAKRAEAEIDSLRKLHARDRKQASKDVDEAKQKNANKAAKEEARKAKQAEAKVKQEAKQQKEEADRMAREEERKAREAQRKAKIDEQKAKVEAEQQAKEAEFARKIAEKESGKAAEEAQTKLKAQKRAEEDAAASAKAAEEEAAAKAAEEAKAKEEAERIQKAKIEENNRKIEEDKKARAAAEAKQQRLQKIKDDYQKRRTQFTNLIGTKFFSGSTKAFSQPQSFHILIYYTEFGKTKDENMAYRKSLAFKATNLKQAFNMFAAKIKGEITLMPLREFALIGNKKLLLTTSIFDDFYESTGEVDKTKHQYNGAEFKNDRISQLFLGFGFQKFLLEWPENTLDCDFEGYQVLMLLGKDSTWIKVGPNYQKALQVFEEKAKDDDASVVLTHSNGKWYKVSGKPNANGLYTDAYVALSGYLQSANHFVGPKTNEQDAGFRMKWQMDKQNIAQLNKLKKFYKGKSARLSKPYTIYGLKYDRDTNEISHFNWRQYYYMNKGVDNVATAIYNQILRPDRNVAYMALIRETVPLYCSEGDMHMKPLCQRMIGYAIFKNWLYPDERMVNEQLSASDRDNYYFVGYFGNLDKPDEVVRKKLDANLKTATDLFDSQFEGTDPKYNVGIMGHTAQRKWWNAKTQYNGKLRNQDIYRLLARYAQDKLKIYNNEPKTEKAAKLVTKEEFDFAMSEKLEKLKNLYKGPGIQMFRQTVFSIVTLDKRTDQITRPWSQRSNSLKNSLTRMSKWVYENIIVKELPIGFIFHTQQNGTPIYCSEGPFDEPACRRMIGQAVSMSWLKSEVLFKSSIPARSKDYIYYGLSTMYVEGEGFGEVTRTNFTDNLKDSMAAYSALFRPQKSEEEGETIKYNVGILLHTARQQILDKTSMLKGNAKYQDSLELMVAYAQKEYEIFQEVPITEKGIKRITTDDAKAQRQEIVKKLRGLYTGKFGSPLYKPYTFSAYVYDNEKNTIRHFHSRTTNMKAGLMNVFSQLNNYMIKPLLDTSYVILVDETEPLYCSVENNFEDPTCRLLIGAAIHQNHLKLDHMQHHNNSNRAINIDLSPKSVDYKFMAYVQDNEGAVKRINLTADQGSSVTMFKTIVGEGKDYQIGIIGHSAKQQWLNSVSQLKGVQANHDVFQMLTTWFQQKRSLFVKAPEKIDEDTAEVMTKQKWQEYILESQANLKKLYTGDGSGLYRNYLWNVLAYQRSSNRFRVIYRQRHWNMKEAMRRMSLAVLDQIVKPENDEAYLYFTSESTAFHCSEGDMENPTCQRMIGYALVKRLMVPEDRKLFNPHFSDKTKDSLFVAYLVKTETGEVVRRNLTKVYAESLTQYKQYFTGKEAKFKTGVISHTKLGQFWTPRSVFGGDKKNLDVYDMMSVYCQRTLNVHLTSGTDESAAMVESREQMSAKWTKKFEKVKGFYKGKGDTLKKPYYFFLATYHEHTHKIQLGWQAHSQNLKASFMQMSRWVYTHIIKTLKPLHYMMASGDSRALFSCSHGKVTESQICQRLIGFSIASNWFREGGKLSWDQFDQQRLFDNRIAPQSDQFEYYALITNHLLPEPTIERVVLGNSAQLNEAVAAYTALFRGGSKANATVGVMLNTRQPNVRQYMRTRFKGPKANMDVYEMIAQYCQKELKAYNEEATDEATAGLKTRKAFNEYLKEQNTKLRALYSGDGAVLYRKHRFVVVSFFKKQMRFRKIYDAAHINLKQAMRSMTQAVYEKIIKPETDEAFLMLVQDTVPIYCSEQEEGKLNTEICQRLLGYAVLTRSIFVPKKAIDAGIQPSSNAYRYVAYLKDSEGKLSKVDLPKEEAKARAQFKSMVKFDKNAEVNYVTGLLGHTARQDKFISWKSRYLSTSWAGARKAMAYFDTYELIAEYLQSELEVFQEAGTDEKALKLHTAEEMKARHDGTFKKLQGLWKGSGEQLAKNYNLMVVWYDRSSKQIGWFGNNKYPRNLKQSYFLRIDEIMSKVVRTNKDYALLLNVKETGPLWCSEGELTEKVCQQIIGQCYRRGAGWLDASFQPHLVDKYIPKADDDYQYVAYLANSQKDDGKVTKLNLTNNWQFAVQTYNAQFKGGEKRKYDLGVLAHSATQQTWYPKSLLSGGEKAYDSFALIAKYAQDELGVYKLSGVDEKTAQVNTTKSFNRMLEKKWKQLKGLYEGPGDQLVKNYRFMCVTYHKRSRQISQIYMRDHSNLRKAFQGLTVAVQNKIVKTQQKMAYLFLSRETIPFHCSEGELAKEPICQRLIGYALFKNWLNPNKKLVDRYLSSAASKYHFVGYLREKESGATVKVDFVKDQAKSRSAFESMIGKTAKYDIGVMGHSAIPSKWLYPVSLMKGSQKNFDVYEMLARYAQDELELYKDSGYDEAALNLVTQKQIVEKQQAALKKLQGLYGGKGERLYKAYYFYVTTLDRRTKAMNLIWGRSEWNMKTAFNQMIQTVFKSIVQRNQDKAYIFGVRDTKPFYCSEEGIEKLACQRMIGHAIYKNWQNGPEEMYNKNIVSKDVRYQYVAYLRKFPEDEDDEESKGEIVKLNLTSNWAAAQKQYNALFEGEDPDYYCGVVSHAQKQEFRLPKTKGVGNTANLDIYEMLAEYATEVGEWDLKGQDEAGARLKTKAEWDAYLKEQFEKLQALNKGTKEPLFKPYTFVATTLGRKNHIFSQRLYQKHRNMKDAMTALIRSIYQTVIKRELDEAFMFMVRETVPFYCSEGDMKADRTCQRMIGYAIVNKWLLPDKSFVNSYLSSASRHYKYMAIVVDNKDNVQRVNLTKNYQQSVAQFKALMEPEDSQYKTGIMGHTAMNQWGKRYSSFQGAQKDLDCYRAIAVYAQQSLGLYKTTGTDEKTAQLSMRSLMEEKHKAALRKLRELYTGKGATLYKQYVFYATTYDKNTHAIQQLGRSGHYSMKAAMNHLVTTVYNNVIRRHQEKAYAFFVQQTTPYHCSEGDLDSVTCRRMIGYALKHNWQKADPAMIDRYLSNQDLNFQYVAYVKDDRLEAPEVVRVNLTNNWQAAVARYNQLIKGASPEYTVGIIGHTQHQNWWYPVTNKTGNLKNMDVYELLAEYCQKDLEIWKASGSDEASAQLKTKEEWNTELTTANNKLKALFKGTGDTLHQQYTFSVFLHHKRSKTFQIAMNQNFWSMKNAMFRMTQVVYKRVYQAEQDYMFLFSVRQAKPLYCSQGEMTKPGCQKMIGWGIYHKYILPGRKMVDRTLSGQKATYIAYLQQKEDDKVIVKNLTQNLNSARKLYMSLFQGQKQLYKCGVIGHSQKHEWLNPISAYKGANKNIDVWQAIASYAQSELDLYTGEALSEKDAKIVTKKQILQKQQKALTKLKDQWKGSGEQLYRPYRFHLVFMDRTGSKSISHTNQNSWTLKSTFDWHVNFIFNRFIKANKDYAWLWIIGDNGRSLFCSDPDMKSAECQTLQGYAYARKLIKTPEQSLFDTEELRPVNDDGSFNTDYTYVAVIKDTSVEDKEGPKFEAIPLNSSDLKVVLPKYKDMVDYKDKDSMKVSVLTHTSIKYFEHWRSRMTENQGQYNSLHDVYQLIGEYVQSKAEDYTKAECSETSGKLVTKKERDAYLKEQLTKLNGIYKGSGGLLAYNQVWHAILVDWSTGVVERIHTQNSRNMKD